MGVLDENTSNSSGFDIADNIEERKTRKMRGGSANNGTFLWRVLPWAWLFLMFGIYLAYLNAHASQHLDADMSSEMVLSKLLSKEGGILSENWYYSTELRVVNTQLVISFFFGIFNNWHTVRMFSSAALMLILLLAFYYLCIQMGCQKYFPLAGSVLLMPFCADYYEFVMLGLYYVPHISFTFVSLGLIFHYSNARKKEEQTAVLFVAFLIAILATLGGARQILVTYLPVILASAAGTFQALKKNGFRRQGKEFWNSKMVSYATCGMFSFAGCFVGHRINNTLLSSKYDFQHYFRLSWTEFSWEGFITVFRGILASNGYNEGYVMTGITIRNGICFLLVVLELWYIVKTIKEEKDNEQTFIVLMLLLGVFCYVILYVFTDMMYSQRYILPIMILIVPLFALAMKEWDVQDKKTIFAFSRYICPLLVFCIFIGCLVFYKDRTYYNMTANLQRAVDKVEEDGYNTGYSTFWQANLVTELSDGVIDMYDWLDAKSQDDLVNVDTIYTWLQDKRHHERPEGKLFLLFTSEEFSRYTLCRKLSRSDAMYDSGGYLIFGYDNYESMSEDLKK